MKKIFPVILVFAFLTSAASAADWKSLTDEAILLSPSAVAALESKEKKTEQDIYALTLVYYREYHLAKLKKLFGDYENKLPDSPVSGLLRGIILMREHRHDKSRAVFNGVLRAHPDFFPARFALGHLSYLQKDFDDAYAIAKKLIAGKKELSRYHYTVSLLLAGGALGFTVTRNWLRAIPISFEVKGYFKEAKKLMPESPEVLFVLGAYHMLTPSFMGGDMELAISMLTKSGRLTPQNAQVYVRLAQAYRAKKDEDAYWRNIARAVELDPQDELLLDHLSGEKGFFDVP